MASQGVPSARVQPVPLASGLGASADPDGLPGHGDGSRPNEPVQHRPLWQTTTTNGGGLNPGKPTADAFIEAHKDQIAQAVAQPRYGERRSDRADDGRPEWLRDGGDEVDGVELRGERADALPQLQHSWKVIRAMILPVEKVGLDCAPSVLHVVQD